MAASRLGSFLALRGAQGVWLMDGPRNPEPVRAFPSGTTPYSRTMAFSKDGHQIAYSDGQRIKVISLPDCQVRCEIGSQRTAALQFSPKGTILAVWEPYITTKDIPAGTPNLRLYHSSTGQLIKGFVQKKQQGWCPQWSEDEGICARNVNNEVQFFENNNFDSIAKKLHMAKVSEFALAPKREAPYHVAVYVPGSKGQPSFVRVFKYPDFGGPNAALANKSFYKADRVELIWNERGNALLVLTATDTSAESYYGEQGLHFVGINGETCLVPRAKNGPVYSVAWNPKSTNFCVVYGFMPAKATLFNLKSEPVFDYGTGPRNVCYFNPQGNLLCLAGFGNLRGNVEFWDVAKQTLLSQLKVPDSTQFEWAPDGEHLVTATTSPRLRVGNGFKIWHYLGNVLYEEETPSGQELWEVTWQPALEGTFAAPRLGRPGAAAQPAETDSVPGITLANVKGGAYVPPHLRNNPAAASSRPKFREEYEQPSNLKQQQSEENMSKQALKNKKKREAKKQKQQQEQLKEEPAAKAAPPEANPAPLPSTGDPEKDKQIKSITKKLQAIEKLKAKQAAGEKLELNQVEKIKTEAALLKEMDALRL